jgi:hypothetical protein
VKKKMMMIITRLIVSTVVALAMSIGLLAVERDTPAEATAMLEKAVAHYKESGVDKRSRISPGGRRHSSIGISTLSASALTVS